MTTQNGYHTKINCQKTLVQNQEIDLMFKYRPVYRHHLSIKENFINSRTMYVEEIVVECMYQVNHEYSYFLSYITGKKDYSF